MYEATQGISPCNLDGSIMGEPNYVFGEQSEWNSGL